MSEFFETIVAVNMYPIKSCQAATVEGAPTESLAIGPVGFEAHGVRDREFVIVEADAVADEPNLFVSQRGWNAGGRVVHRTDSRLASVGIDIGPKAIRVTSSLGELVLQTEYSEEGDLRDVAIHGKLLPRAINQGPESAKYLSQLLDRDVLLVRANRSHPRFLLEKYWRPDASNQVAGADGMPFLWLNQASLNYSHGWNNLELDTVPIDRYRGSIVSNGTEIGPYGEDRVRLARFGAMAAYAVKGCTRCIQTNVRQTDGEIVGGGLRVLRGRTGYVDDPSDKGIFFGQNLNHVYEPEDKVRVSAGDRISIVDEVAVPNFTLLG